MGFLGWELTTLFFPLPSSSILQSCVRTPVILQDMDTALPLRSTYLLYMVDTKSYS